MKYVVVNVVGGLAEYAIVALDGRLKTRLNLACSAMVNDDELSEIVWFDHETVFANFVGLSAAQRRALAKDNYIVVKKRPSFEELVMDSVEFMAVGTNICRWRGQLGETVLRTENLEDVHERF